MSRAYRVEFNYVEDIIANSQEEAQNIMEERILNCKTSPSYVETDDITIYVGYNFNNEFYSDCEEELLCSDLEEEGLLQRFSAWLIDNYDAYDVFNTCDQGYFIGKYEQYKRKEIENLIDNGTIILITEHETKEGFKVGK